MDTELKTGDSNHQCSSLDSRIHSGNGVQQEDSAHVDEAAGTKSPSSPEDPHKEQADLSKDADIQQQFDTAEKDNRPPTDVHATKEKISSDLFLESVPCRESVCLEETSGPSPESETAGFPDTQSESSGLTGMQSGVLSDISGFPETQSQTTSFQTSNRNSLESYLSDFKSSSSSEWGLQDMSASHIDGLIGKLDPAAPEAQDKGKKEEEEDVEDDRCPSTFYVSISDREDSWPMKCLPGEDTLENPFSIIVEEDQGDFQKHSQIEHQNAEKEKSHDDKNENAVQAEVVHETHGSDSKDENHEKNVTATAGSGDKEESASGTLPAVCTKQDKGDPPRMRPVDESFRPLSSSSCQILSEEHRQALELLGLSDMTVALKGEAANFGLDASSLSTDGSSPVESLRRKVTEKISHSHNDRVKYETTPFVSDYCEEDILRMAEIGSRTQGFDPEYIKDGYILNIEDEQPAPCSDNESDMSVGSPCRSPPLSPQPHFACDSQVTKKEDTLSSRDTSVEGSQNPHFNKNNMQGDHHYVNPDCPEDLASSLINFSMLDLQSRMTAGRKEVAEVKPVTPVHLNTEGQNNPDSNTFRPVPAPRRKVAGQTHTTVSQTNASHGPQIEPDQTKASDAPHHGLAESCVPPSHAQRTVTRPGQPNLSHNAQMNQFTAKPNLLEYNAYLDKIMKLSGNTCQPVDMPPCKVQWNNANFGMPVHKSPEQGFSPQSEKSQCFGMDPTGVQILSGKTNGRTVCGHGDRYGNDDDRVQPCSRSSQPSLPQRGQQACHNLPVPQGEKSAVSHVSLTSAHNTASPPPRPELKDTVPQQSGPRGHQPNMEAEKERKTVMVTGESLDKEQEDLCELYFENTKRSDGGEIQEGGIVWDGGLNCFFITFVDSTVAKRVAGREHTLKNSPVQVKMWSPPEQRQSAVSFHDDRVLISGILPTTTSDCLSNYLECMVDMEVRSVEKNENGRSATVVFKLSDNKLDIQEMEKVCMDSPLDDGVKLHFCAVPISDAGPPADRKPTTSTILVTGLKPETATDAVQFFFSNKRRNAGGPVKNVDRASDRTSALVHFINPEDAESVVKKGDHTLDGYKLQVTLHEGDSGDGAGEQGAAGHPPLTSSVPSSSSSSSRVTVSTEEERLGSQYQPPGSQYQPPRSQYQPPGSQYQPPRTAHQIKATQMIPSSSGGREDAGSQYSTSASAQIQQATGELRYPLSQDTGGGHQYSQGDASYFTGTQTGKHAQPQTSKSLDPLNHGAGYQRDHQYNSPGNADYFAGSRTDKYAQPLASKPSDEASYTGSALRYPYPSQEGRIDSSLINSSLDQPKDKHDFDGISYSAYDRGPQASGSHSSPQYRNPSPPEPAVRPQLGERPSSPLETKSIEIKLGEDIINEITRDSQTLRLMITVLKSVDGKFCWKRPDHIAITCVSGNPCRDWDDKVSRVVNNFVEPVRKRLLRPEKDSAFSYSHNMAYRDHNRPGMSDTLPKDHASSPSAAASEGHRPSCLKDEESFIPNLKAGQMKILRLPKALEKLYREYPGLRVSVDEDSRTATVTAPERFMKKAFTDVLALVTTLREMKIPLSLALVQMYRKRDAREWIQKTLIEKYDLLCYWELCDDHIELSGQNNDLTRLETMFRTAFKEATVILTEKELCLLKSSVWTSYVEKIQESGKEGCPSPALLHEGNQVVIVDTPSSISQTRLALRKFLDENKLEKELLPMNPNHVRFLQQFYKEETKAIHTKAKERGISVIFNKSGMLAEGPQDGLAGVVQETKDLMDRIKEDKMTFKKPGVAMYLTGTKGQEFLAQTGTATGCFITTHGADGVSAGGTDSRVLAEINLDSSHQLLIVQGDITQCQVDAIVNAANTALAHAGGVAQAIVKAGGDSIQEESDALLAEGPLCEGEVVVTGAGSLACSHVLHAVGPTWKGGMSGEERLLKRTVMETLNKAETMKLSSLALPAISCGIFRYPVDKATDIILRCICQFLREKGAGCCLKKLILIDVTSEPLQGFLTAAKHLLGKLVIIKGQVKSSNASGKQGEFHASNSRSDRDSHSESGRGGKSQGPIKIISGEIARSRADVIVCTTHPSLDLRKGVLSKSILEKGGESIQQDLKKYADKYGPAQPGKPVRSAGGNLDCKSVYHLTLPTWRSDHGETMHSAVKECLDGANKKGARTIAFPTLGTGRLGYPGDQVATIMFSAIGQWFERNSRSSIKEVQIVVFNKDNETLEALRRAEREDGGGGRDDGERYGGGGHGGHRHNGDRHGSGRHGADHHSGDRHGGNRHGGHSGGRGHGHGHGHGDRGGDFAGAANSLKTKVGGITVMVKDGNILNEPCDAIVNSSNDNLDLSVGVLSKEIMKVCGQDLMAECREQRDRMAETGVAITRVESNGLSCGNVIHISADRFKRDWEKGILAVLQAADAEDISSVSLPALGTGGRGADPRALAEAMHRAVSQFSRRARCLKEVRVVVFQKQMLSPYIAAFDPNADARGAEGPAVREAPAERSGNKREDQSLDVYIYSNKHAAIKEAREKIHRHVQDICSSLTETNPIISSFSPKQLDEVLHLQNKHKVDIKVDQKKGAVTVTGIDINVAKAISEMKDIMLSVTTQRHLAAGMPPVRWQYETGKDKFADFEPNLVLTIEAAFKKKEREVHFADKRGRKYKIVFKDRKEYPVDHPGHPVTVKRRDILEEKKQEMPLPTHWDPMKGEKVKRVPLKPDSNEYKRVAEHFGGQAQIKKIERIQNPTLFQQFKVKKKELDVYNPKGTENEKRLFHGTPSDSVEGIITNGFNRSYCGRHGTALGAGVYFAANSSVSMGYAQGGHMFQSRVLVGEYTQGNSGMRMPPNKPNSNRPYDSVGDANQNASVFVIFHDSQAYPEYLISF